MWTSNTARSHRHDRLSSQLTNCTLHQEHSSAPTPQQHSMLLLQINQALEMAELEKVHQIRVSQWLSKLSNCPNNLIWSKNVNFYLNVLLLMIKNEQLNAPFSHPPPNTTLPTLTLYDLPYPLREQLQPTQTHTSRSKSKAGHSHTKQKGKNNLSVNKKTYIVDQLDYNLQGMMPVISVNQENSVEQLQVEELCMEQVIRPPPSAKSRHSGYKSHSRVRKATLSHNHNKQNVPQGHNSQAVSRKLFASKQKALSLTQLTQDEASMAQSSVIKYSLEGPTSTPHTDTLLDLLQKCTSYVKQHQKELESAQQAQQACVALTSFLSKQSSNQRSLDESVLSEKSHNLIKTSEKLQQKFSEGTQETMEFLNFLQRKCSQPL